MKDDKIYLIHIIESIRSIESYIEPGESEFFRSKLIQDAVIRNLEIIGEATKRISKELRLKEYDIPWKEMAGLRDVLIHDYFGVDLDILWNVVRKELPRIHILIQSLIEET
ncbi:DUF86 domain-containing protein [Serpentinicella alkaliphila]|uniref:HepT-like ribonuclease domain-containing protein n=1 Tax=Serpentinicella alkaliphila TaxID=1734049 RepID=UPI001BC85173|nr:DUF86 domain-containing protein [Serpentinicella alkaliphila]QUH26148.1 DUF86 domain-containing protein [Serpentinicella alkaliphila]QUH26156.1 DUF86 domain-containing protein [Serpentinicella alkaliphila]